MDCYLIGDVFKIFDPQCTVIIKGIYEEDIVMPVEEAMTEYNIWSIKRIYPTVSGRICVEVD